MEVFNRALALARLDGDDERLKDSLAAFQKNVPYVMKDLESASSRKDRERIESLAIELRESVRRIGAEGMEDLAAQMIAAVREGELGRMEELLTHMGMELDWLLRVLDENRCSGCFASPRHTASCNQAGTPGRGGVAGSAWRSMSMVRPISVSPCRSRKRSRPGAK